MKPFNASPRMPYRLALSLVTLSVMAACSSKADRIESGLRKGAELAHQASWDKANVEMRNVLQIDPKNAQAYFISGQIAEGQSDLQRAYNSYLKTLELKPDHIDAKVGLARVYLIAGEAAKALGEVEEVLRADAAHVGARTLQAVMTARSGNVDKAIEQAQSALALTKEPSVELTTVLAGLHVARGESVKGLEAIDQGLKRDPKNLTLLKVAAQLTSDPKAPAAVAARADEFHRRVTEQSPNSDDGWNVWAGFYARQGRPADAEKVLREAAKARPDETKRVLTLIEYVAAQRGYDAARQEFATAIDKHPKDTTLRFGLVRLHRAANHAAEARQALQAVIDLAPSAPAALEARNLLAADRMAGGQIAEARALIAEVLQASPHDNAALVLRGRLELRDGQSDAAIADLRAVSRDQPGSVEVAGLLAQAHMLAGESQLAREVLASAVKFKPADPDLRMLLAAHMADAKEYGDAIVEIDTALKTTPNVVRLYEVKAQLQYAQKDAAGAEKTLLALRDQFPKQPIGYLRLGQFHSDQKHYDQALKAFDSGAAAVTGDPTLVLSSIGVLLAQKRYAEIDARIEAMAKAEPKSPLPHQVRGDVEMSRRSFVAAEAAYRKMLSLAPNAPQSYQSVAKAMAARNDMPGALALLEQGEKALPADLTLAATRAEWLVRVGKTDEAIKLYEQVLVRAPGDDGATNNLAYLLVEIKGDAASLQRASALTSRFAESSNPSYLDSLGWVHYRRGDYAKAVPVLERAVTLQPGAPLLNTHLGMALVKGGDTKRGQDILRKVIESKAVVPNADEVRKLAGLG